MATLNRQYVEMKKHTNLVNLLSDIYTDKSNNSLFPTAISHEEGVFIRNQIEKIKPKNLIEIGLGHAITSLWIQSSMRPPQTHIIIDPQPSKSALKKINTYTRSEIKKTTSQIYLASLLQEQNNGQIDCIVMDGDERFDGFTVDMYFALKILKKGGIIIARNVWNPSVTKSLMFFVKNTPIKLQLATNWENQIVTNMPLIGSSILKLICKSRSNGLCILVKTDQDKRRWNHYVDF